MKETIQGSEYFSKSSQGFRSIKKQGKSSDEVYHNGYKWCSFIIRCFLS